MLSKNVYELDATWFTKQTDINFPNQVEKYKVFQVRTYKPYRQQPGKAPVSLGHYKTLIYKF